MVEKFIDFGQIFKSDNFQPDSEVETDWFDSEDVKFIRDLLFKYQCSQNLDIEIKYKNKEGFETDWSPYSVLNSTVKVQQQQFLTCGNGFKFKFRNTSGNTITDGVVWLEGVTP